MKDRGAIITGASGSLGKGVAVGSVAQAASISGRSETIVTMPGDFMVAH